MASMDMEEQLEEQQQLEEKPKIEDFQEPSENAEIIDANLAKSTKEDKELGTSTTMADLPRHRKLPPELDRQIFLCFNPATQRKFIYGLGWDFYDMFRYKLLIKTKRARNPHENRWNGTNTRATVAANGLNVSKKAGISANVFAVQPFPTSGPQCRVDGFPGTICYYYEVEGDLWWTIGLSDGNMTDDCYLLGENSYGIFDCFYYFEYWLAGEIHRIELPEGYRAIQPRRKRNGSNVYGCGLVLDPADKLWIFFTLNGKLLSQKTPINPTVDRLFPQVKLVLNASSSIEANFGDNPERKPFEYDIKNCPGLGLACI